MRKKGFTLLFVFFALICRAQSSDDLMLGASAHYGFIIQHRSSMQHLITGHVSGFDLDIAHQTDAKKNWQVLYKNPFYGVKLYYADLGNPSVLGQGYGIIPYMSFPIARSKFYSLSFTVGTGFGYITKVFNTGENHKNIAIGTHINGIMHGEWVSQIRLADHLKFKAGFALTHFSNGAVKIPNLGINVPTMNAGFIYSFGTHQSFNKSDTIHTRLTSDSKKIINSVFITASLKEISPIGGKKYSVFSVSDILLKPLNRKSSLGLALDVFYHSSLRQLQSDSAGNLAPASKAVRVGIGLPYSVRIQKFMMIFQVGTYILDSYQRDGFIYQRIGFYYRLKEHLLLNYTLKLHFGKADNLELGLGYRF